MVDPYATGTHRRPVPAPRPDPARRPPLPPATAHTGSPGAPIVTPGVAHTLPHGNHRDRCDNVVAQVGLLVDGRRRGVAGGVPAARAGRAVGGRSTSRHRPAPPAGGVGGVAGRPGPGGAGRDLDRSRLGTDG